MNIKNIDFPNQILDAINNHNLVVFAGAGTSFDKPTSLPSFEKLANEIAEGTEFSLMNNDSCEVFLGMLKAKGIPVNELAVEILTRDCKEHNKLHEAIVDLFPESNDIKIVTTNYDQMFESVLSARGFQVPIYNIPAIPLGNDIQGIIHIHGNVNNPRYMIVTDEDFGKAYLTEGYASKFLVKLFETYTVLFIGYSYNDTILRYLTRAMSRENINNRFVITDDINSDWSTLGINPIWFPKKKYSAIRESLVQLGIIAKRGLIDWKNQLSQISDAPPKDLTADTEIDYCLESLEKSRVLASSLHGKEWIVFLDGKKVFNGCFSSADLLSELDLIWGEWLCENFVGIEDKQLFQLFYKHNNSVSKGFVNILARKLVNNEKLLDEMLSIYILLVENQLYQSWLIFRLIEELNKRNLILLSFRLFKKLLNCKLVFQKGWYFSESYEYSHFFDGGYYEIYSAWRLIGEKMCYENAYAVMTFVQTKIDEIQNIYASADSSSVNTISWKMQMLNIENIEEYDYSEDPLQVLAQMYLNAAVSLKGRKRDLLRNILLQNISSEMVLLKRLSLKAIRITNAFSPKRTIDLLINNNLIYALYVKEQVFLLVENVFNKLEEKDINRLIDAIETLKQNCDCISDYYSVYNWFIWIQRIDGGNKRVNKKVDELHNIYGFEPRNHPELDIESSSLEWIPDKSPLTEEELKKKPISKVVIYLKDYKSDSFEGPNRYGLLKVLESCVSKDYKWTRKLINELIRQRIDVEEIWQHLFNGLEGINLSISDSVELLELLVPHIGFMKYDRELANLMLEILRRADIKKDFPVFESRLYIISEMIWNSRNRKKVDLNETVSQALNTTTGIILLSWIHMLSYMKDVKITNWYKKQFENALNLCTWEKDVSICILVGYFNFLCYRDKEWCILYLAPFLTGDNKRYFSIAWEGMIFFSGRINRDTIDIISPIFLKAVEKINWLDKETKHGFIELLLTLLIYVINKPTLKFIPTFYRATLEEDRVRFIEAIEYRLKSMSNIEKQKWWDNWLGHFLENRKKNKPVPLTEGENKKILNLIVELDAVFEEAVQIICRGAMPQNTDGLFWYSLSDKKLAIEYPQATAFVVTRVLNSSLSEKHEELYIREIVKEINGLNVKEQKQLQEALIKNNILI